MILSIREEGRALEGMGVAWTIAVSSVAVSIIGNRVAGCGILTIYPCVEQSSRLLLNLRGFINGGGEDNSLKVKTDKTTMRFEHEHGAVGTASLGQEVTTSSEDTEEETGSDPICSLDISEVPV